MSWFERGKGERIVTRVHAPGGYKLLIITLNESNGRVDSLAINRRHLAKRVELNRPWARLDVAMNRLHTRPLYDNVRLPLDVTASTSH